MGCGGSKKAAEKAAGKVVSVTETAAVTVKQSQANMKVHIGPLEVGSDGVALKPKFNLGIQGASLYAMAGVSDVRDGVRVEGLAMAMKTYSTSGSSIVEILNNVKAEENIPALDDLVKAVPDIIASVLETLSTDVSDIVGDAQGAVYIYVGAGVSAGLWLGWLDTNGYRMFGVEGRIASAMDVGLTVRAGVHESTGSVRVIAYMTNVGFDIVVKPKKPAVMTE
eukprot:TRINITY_DN56126_c0_g1_i1.p1 TRINITY_DN56126_c0_g1~~TRINITY_DN56126_c0_g1_i1.p1  ORF type:complete len:223 (-),score=32.84 TRINITY_DN56126_c0_g1_i1:370-1038(-)